MNDLLHPCRSTLRWRDDKHIRGIGLIVEPPLPPFWRRKVFHPFVHFFYGCGTRICFLLAHLLPPLRFVRDCHTERRFAARQCRCSVGSLPSFHPVDEGDAPLYSDRVAS